MRRFVLHPRVGCSLGRDMTPDEREQMHILCQRLAVEHDRRKFAEYVDQMNELLQRKSDRLQTASKLELQS